MVKHVPQIFSEEGLAMRTDTSFVVVSHEPALLPGMRHFSKATKGVLAALAVMLVSFGTSALAADGPYVGIGGSLSILNDSNVTAPAREPFKSLNANATTDNGFAVRGMAGYAFPSGLRVEAEIDYRRHKTDKMDVNSAGGVALSAFAQHPGFNPMGLPARELLDEYRALPETTKKLFEDGAEDTHIVTGAFSMLAFMVNMDYDFDMGSPWKPYVGGGLGVASISLDAESADGESFVDDRDTVFAYQVGAGIGYEFPLPEGRSVTVSLDWRYFGTQTPTFTGAVTGNEFQTEISGHDIGIGLMYGF